MEQKVVYFRRIVQVSFAILVAAVTFFISSRTAQAYVLFPWKWSTSSAVYDPHTMSATWITIASDGRTAWNNVSPSPWNISRNDTSANDVTYAPIDGAGGTLGGVGLYCSGVYCSVAGQTVTSAGMIFDNAENWHTSSNCMVPANQFDARSNSTHEFGHFSTLNHSGVAAATMWGGLAPGNCNQRSLETDDINGLNAQWP